VWFTAGFVVSYGVSYGGFYGGSYGGLYSRRWVVLTQRSYHQKCMPIMLSPFCNLLEIP
jgi:hypothetical protein